ncbi:hypothetical protein KFE94_04150 [bacterium SCSIO 12643]|nr:hypothetical protein KFE94_04150 [bacterium SCSIO 12643]
MHPSDNIGLTDFFVLIFKFCKRNLALIVISTVIGLLLGYSYNHFSKKYYLSEMVGYSNLVEKNIVLEILAPLNKFAEEKNFSELSKNLNISEETAAAIRSIDFATSKHNKTSNNPKLTDQKLGELILTTLTVYNQDKLPEIEKGIVNFLENNSYLKEKTNTEKAKTTKLIQNIAEKIESFDSIYNHPNQISKGSGSPTINVTSSQSPTDFVESYEYLEDLKNKAEHIRSFQVVSHFYYLSKPDNKQLLIISGLGVVFFISSLLLALLKEIAVLSKKEG